MPFLFCVLFLLLGFVLSLHSPPHLVSEIPRYSGPIVETIHTGYVTTNVEYGRNLFYYFVLARDNPADKPVVLWLNGGPGCSGGLAFISEHGPYNLYENGDVEHSMFSLNAFANVIYLDSPAGVGFSYETNAEADKNIGDDQTSADIFIFLQEFFGEVFPAFAGNDFYIWGESYGGHYVPLAAAYIVNKQEKSGTDDVKINLKGIAVNNGMYAFEHYINGVYWDLFGHSIVSYNQFTTALDTCKGNFWQNRAEKDCAAQIALLQTQAFGLLKLNVEEDCYPGYNVSFPGMTIRCWNSRYLDEYFGLPESRKAFGVSPNFTQYTKNWETCNSYVGKVYNITYMTVIPQVTLLYSRGLKIFIMNGELDSACTSLSNQWTVNDVLGEKLPDFPPWLYVDDVTGEKQVGGFYQMKDNLVFVTVRGAGHMISSDQPERSFDLYRMYFDNSFPN